MHSYFQGILKEKDNKFVAKHSKMNQERKRTCQIKARLPDMRSLKAFSAKLTSKARSNLVHKYGKIIDLLNIPVQVEAITALAQFYDPPLRCFTFQDFQLAPTLEEFEQSWVFPIKGRVLSEESDKL